MPKRAAPSAGSISCGLISRLRKLATDGLFCDVTFAVGEERIGAHQAVLSASSARLRKLLAEGRNELPTETSCYLPVAPVPSEIYLDASAVKGEPWQPDAVRSALDQLYGSMPCENSASLKAAGRLATVLGSPTAGPVDEASLLAGLARLRSENQLCDIVLKVADERFPAHQVVLAAASDILCDYISSNLAELVASEKVEKGTTACCPLELELAGISHPGAVRSMLDHIYGVVPLNEASELNTSAEDVLMLADAFDLPSLAAHLAAAFDLPSLAADFGSLSSAGASGVAAASPTTREVSLEEAVMSAESGDELALENDEGEEEEDADDAREEEEEDEVDDAVEDDEAEEVRYDKAMQVTQEASFSNRAVPGAALTGLKPEKLLSPQNADLLERLKIMFMQRPVWLIVSIKEQLPPEMHHVTLMELLPYVAYQWRDGPWQTAYSRLGWNPRENAEDAKGLQVIEFRDPFFRSHGGSAPVGPGGVRAAARAAAEAVADCHFLLPPGTKSQMYQLVDIMDDFVQGLIDASPMEPFCSKKSGWLDPFILSSVHDRMSVHSDVLRKKRDAKLVREAAKAKAEKTEARAIALGEIEKQMKKSSRAIKQAKVQLPSKKDVVKSRARSVSKPPAKSANGNPAKRVCKAGA